MAASCMSRRALGLSGGVVLGVSFMAPLGARQAPAACRIIEHSAGGTTALPGVSITLKSGDTTKLVTSTEIDGTFAINVTPGQYTLSADLTGFAHVDRPLVVACPEPCRGAADGACNQAVNIDLALAPRQALQSAARAPQQAVPVAAANSPRARDAQPLPERAQVQPQAEANAPQVATAGETNAPDEAARLLLPAGFSTDAPADAITITGNAASIDRGMMNDRFDAIGRGVFDPATGEFSSGFGGAGAPGVDGQLPGGRGGPGGRG